MRLSQVEAHPVLNLVRELRWASREGERTVNVRLSAPFPDDRAWGCLLAVESDHPFGPKPVWGIDGMQATDLALRLAETLLDEIRRGGELSWPDGSRYDPPSNG